jgi:glycosyltransferase involved in cell wall biosynthesis
MVHGYTNRFEIQVVRAARRFGIPVLQRGEFSDGRPSGTRLYRRVLRRAFLKWFYGHVRHFCYIGQNARGHLLQYGVSEERMFFSPYSVDSDFFEEQRAQLDREECRRRLGVTPNQLVVLFSGKFIPRKDPLLLLEAVARLEDRERITLIMLGDGELRQQIHTRAREILGEHAILPGFVNQMQLGQYFRAADVFVLPSLFETWGLVVNEAMQFGLPCLVSSGVNCHPDLVLPGKTGFVFPVGGDAELANLLQAFVKDPTLTSRLGLAARCHIEGYSTEASVAGIHAAFGLENERENQEPAERAVPSRS